MAKSRERLMARELRRHGESIREIAKKVGISRSSSSAWCRDILLTPEQTESLIQRDKDGGAKGRMISAELSKKRKLTRINEDKKFGFEKVGSLSTRELFLVGVGLYWAEGSKSLRTERFVFVNSDPKMIKLMIRWLRECIGVPEEDIVCRVGINEMHRERIVEVQNYWSNITGIPLSHFKNTSFKKVVNKKIYDNYFDHYGTLDLLVRKCTRLFYKILGSIEGFADDNSLPVVK